MYFYPRSPRGERLVTSFLYGGDGEISIHAPREGSDRLQQYLRDYNRISIHAPREGSDRGFSRFNSFFS